MTHIVWDWNGTLFHDIEAVVGATNEVFKPYGRPPMDVRTFREYYTRPIWVAYERILGRPLEVGEWDRLDQRFHDNYHRLMVSCGLAEGAVEALGAWDGSQSLLSMWSHDRLLRAVADFGIDHHFSRVDGLRAGGPGGHKAEHLRAHVAELGVAAADVLVIGDSVDDADAAAHVGARVILYSGGMTRREDLVATGLPVVDSLAAALHARIGVSRQRSRDRRS